MHHIFDYFHNIVDFRVIFVKFRVVLLHFIIISFPVVVNHSLYDEEMFIQIVIHIVFSNWHPES